MDPFTHRRPIDINHVKFKMLTQSITINYDSYVNLHVLVGLALCSIGHSNSNNTLSRCF